MRFPHKRLHTLLLVITIIPAVLLASFFLFMGVGGLIVEDPERVLAESILVGGMLILTAAVLIYALFRPYSGGFFLCICAVPFGFTFNAFHLSNVLYPSREAGYHPFWSTITGLVLLLGVLSIIRGRLSRRTASKDPEQPS